MVSKVGSEGFFKDKSPEEAARFLAHPFPPAAGAAAKALASRGEKSLPLINKLLQDSHPAIRLGAINALAIMYHYDGKEMREEIPEDLAGSLKSVRPLIRDDDAWVRSSVANFFTSLKVLNEDIYEVLYVMASDPDGSVRSRAGSIARYNIKDADVRIKIYTLMTDVANRTESQVPQHYGLGIVTTSHAERCQPAIQAAIDVLANPKVMALSGMFSDSATHSAMTILVQFADDPRVTEALPIILRMYTRKGSGRSPWWNHLLELPRRILLRIGPSALPSLREFIDAERKLFAQVASSDTQPTEVKISVGPGHELRFQELEEVSALIPCLHGTKPLADSVSTMCRIYLERHWSETERSLIRERMLALGPPTVPLIRKAVEELPALVSKTLDTRIEVLKADGASDKWQITPVKEHQARIPDLKSELEDFASLIEFLKLKQPAEDSITSLCRLYIRPDWSIHRQPIRDTLQRWGVPSAASIRSFVKSDEPYRSTKLTQYDEEEAHARTTLRFGRGLDGALVRLELARKDLNDLYSQLTDLATVIEAGSAKKATGEALTDLCRIYVRRAWPSQNESLRKLLERTGKAALPAIREHVKSEKDYLPEVVHQKYHFQPYTARSRYKCQFERWKDLEAKITKGVAALEELAKRIAAE